MSDDGADRGSTDPGPNNESSVDLLLSAIRRNASDAETTDASKTRVSDAFLSELGLDDVDMSDAPGDEEALSRLAEALIKETYEAAERNADAESRRAAALLDYQDPEWRDLTALLATADEAFSGPDDGVLAPEPARAPRLAAASATTAASQSSRAAAAPSGSASSQPAVSGARRGPKPRLASIAAPPPVAGAAPASRTPMLPEPSTPLRSLETPRLSNTPQHAASSEPSTPPKTCPETLPAGSTAGGESLGAARSDAAPRAEPIDPAAVHDGAAPAEPMRGTAMEVADGDAAPSRDAAPRDAAPRDAAPRDAAPRDAAPRDAAADGAAVQNAPSEDRPSEAPPPEAPPSEAPPSEVPPSEVPPSEVPSSEVPPAEALPTDDAAAPFAKPRPAARSPRGASVRNVEEKIARQMRKEVARRAETSASRPAPKAPHPSVQAFLSDAPVNPSNPEESASDPGPREGDSPARARGRMLLEKALEAVREEAAEALDAARQAQDGSAAEPKSGAKAEASTEGGATGSAVTPKTDVAVAPSATAQDDVDPDALRPALSAWLDAHLPELIERVLRDEMARQASGGRQETA